MSTIQFYRWVFTVNYQVGVVDPESEDSQNVLKKVLGTYCKKWCFQVERGELSDLVHFQGRISLSKKLRKADVIKLICRDWNVYWDSERDESGSAFYVQKEETRVAGPWSDKDRKVYIPRQIRGIELVGWQSQLRDELLEFNTRRIHFVLDLDGGIGKSTFCTVMEIKYQAINIPSTMHTADDMMQYVCKMLGDKKSDVVILLDIPRSVTAKEWPKWLSVLECLKNGKVYDHRYTATCVWFDSPGIAVFTNSLPPENMLTADRWQVMKPNRFDAAQPAPLLAAPAEVIDLSQELSD